MRVRLRLNGRDCLHRFRPEDPAAFNTRLLTLPHDDGRLDTWAKVKGLAKFADNHHLEFDRLLVGRIVAGKLEVVDVSNGPTREKALKMGAPGDLEALFKEA